MDPNTLRNALWMMSLARNPYSATYGVRVSSTTTTGSDTFTNYNLSRVTPREMTIEEMEKAGIIAPQQGRVWTIYQADLDNATLAPPSAGNAPSPPPPQVDYQLTVNGQTWIAKRVVAVGMTQAWEMHCLLAW